MNVQKLIKWDALTNIKLQLYLDILIEDQNGLRLTLNNTENDDVLEIEFKMFIKAYQSREELATLSDLEKSPMLISGPLFIVENSNYIDWLTRQSGQVLEDYVMVHTKIVHANGIIDVVTSELPIVRWVDNG